MSDTSNAAIIAANLKALQARLRRCHVTVAKACRAMAVGSQNQAIGGILDLQTMLAECDALYRTIILLHRSNDSLVLEGGAA